ncbi:MAG: GNAT family N-acetyltransferase, partial [Bacteroidia bacterium]|nr:GNAT family N-acetyltransferase [Bacteroidia bacterium]
IKEFDPHRMEVKRMYTHKEKRGKGLAGMALGELEKWTKELGYSGCILETGIRQKEAIRLYEKNGYKPIPNYGQYIGITESSCFEKQL